MQGYISWHEASLYSNNFIHAKSNLNIECATWHDLYDFR